MGGAKAEKILRTFEKDINKLSPESFIQISSDGPNVNLRFLKLFAEKRESGELPPLIQIGTCGLHTIHGSMKTGIKNSHWNTGKILKAAWKLLDEAPAQGSYLRKYQKPAYILYPAVAIAGVKTRIVLVVRSLYGRK